MANNSDEPNKTIVTIEELYAASVESPLEQTRSVDCADFRPLFSSAIALAEKEGNTTKVRTYTLLKTIVEMHFKPNDQAEPYGPMLVIDGKRSAIPSDLAGEQSVALSQLAVHIRNAGLRARLADIVWLNDRRQATSARIAVQSYMEALRLVQDGTATFFNESSDPTSPHGVEYLLRACQIARMTGWKQPEANDLQQLALQLARHATNINNCGGYLRLSKSLFSFEFFDYNEIATESERLASIPSLYPETSRQLWEMAATAQRRLGKEQEQVRCLVEAAECYTKMAETFGLRGMAAASWLTDAIRALRALPNTKARRDELETLLREAQASIFDEIGTFSTEIDLSDLADEAQKAIAGLTLAQAFAQFSLLEKSPRRDDLYESAKKQVEEHPLSSMIPRAIHDDEGRVVATSPGLFSGDDQNDDALRHLIISNEAFRRHTVVYGLILPARHLMQAEHPLEVGHFLPLVQMSPFVPPGREHIFAQGFARFFGGDFISSTYLLVPQVENSIRYILKISGGDPSRIKPDMTQENLTLSSILDNKKEQLEQIFGDDILFEIDNLFNVKGGPSLRHEVAHGLCSDGACNGPESIYGCWFVFHLCCLPLLQHWEKVTVAYEQL